ncbi:hypothetical protein SAMN05445504_3725 [Burkholderia sp. CF099]|nr:hypothetical protein SAMN05445504_3725 [Burkholderia sp. CF099]
MAKVQQTIAGEAAMNIFELPLPFETPRHIRRPLRDPYDKAHGDGYKPSRTAATMNLATRSTFPGVKVLRNHEALSMQKLRAILHFSFSPYVVDIREEYPLCSLESHYRAKAHGVSVPESEQTICNLNLALVLPPDFRLHYHTVSLGSKADETGLPLSPRDRREYALSLERGWTWQKVNGDRFTKKEYGNNLLMSRWISQVNIWKYQESARALADRVKTRSLRGTLAHVLERHARHMGISVDHAFELFAVAVSFGFLYIDHTEYLRVDMPLVLRGVLDG